MSGDMQPLTSECEWYKRCSKVQTLLEMVQTLLEEQTSTCGKYF